MSRLDGPWRLVPRTTGRDPALCQNRAREDRATRIRPHWPARSSQRVRTGVRTRSRSSGCAFARTTAPRPWVQAEQPGRAGQRSARRVIVGRRAEAWGPAAWGAEERGRRPTQRGRNSEPPSGGHRGRPREGRWRRSRRVRRARRPSGSRAPGADGASFPCRGQQAGWRPSCSWAPRSASSAVAWPPFRARGQRLTRRRQRGG